MYSLGLNLVTMKTLVDQISRSTPPSMVNATLQNIFDQSVRNGSQLKAILQGVATILMNRPILVNNLLEFHSQKQPKPSLFRSSDTNYKPAAVSSFSQVISLHPKNSVEHWTSHTERHFLGQLKPYSNFFTKNRVVDGHS